MSGRFTGRRAIVTGASRGIGAGIAERLAAEGASVAIVARTVAEGDRPNLAGSLESTATKLRAYGNPVALIAADLTDGDDRARIVPEAVEQLGGPVEILVNNAAAAMYAQPSEMPLKRRRITFEVNVHAPLDLAQAALPAMLEAGEGWIVNVSSATGRLSSGPPYNLGGLGATTGMYGASKAALNRETNALAHELWGRGIRVNTVEPRAAVMSEGAEVLAGHVIRDDQKESMEEMVEAAVYLCDCDADTTGQVFVSLDLIADRGVTVMTLDGEGPWSRPMSAG
jgi:NAD(P)-dependent dehydrogenase (short-subunit alcohol dehydrogenase family)